MVSVAFKTVFLALFVLPQVLAVPGGTVPRGITIPRKDWPKIPASIQDEALRANNMIRSRANVSPLTWSTDLQSRASNALRECPGREDASVPGTSSDGCPYSPRMLMFKLTENFGYELTAFDSIIVWDGDNPRRARVVSPDRKQVGCAIGDCSNPVRIVSPTFICRSDLRMPYRTVD